VPDDTWFGAVGDAADVVEDTDDVGDEGEEVKLQAAAVKSCAGSVQQSVSFE
jgi:hypothetical protein